MVSGWQDKKAAKRSAKRIRRRMLPMLDVQYREQQRQSRKAELATLGAQRTGYAAANVMTGRGTARLLEEETSDEFARARRLAALSYSAERTAAVEGARVSGPNYASGLASLTQSIGQAYQVGKEAGVWGQ
jgi:hypothetical protein